MKKTFTISKTVSMKSFGFLFVMLVYIESIILTSSRLLSIGLVSSKMITSALAFVCALPFIICRKKYFMNSFCKMILIMFFLLALNYLRAVVFRQELNLAKSFIKPFIYLAYCPVLLYYLDSKSKLDKIRNIMILLGTILSICNIIFSFICFVNTSLFWKLVIPLYEKGIILILVNNGVTSRLMFSGVIAQFSTIFLAASLYIEKKKKICILIMIINIAGIFLTYTRGLYAGVIIGALVFLCKSRQFRNRAKKSVREIVIISIIVILTAISIIVLLGGGKIILYAFQRLFSLDIFSGLNLGNNFYRGFDYEINAAGNDIRKLMMEKLYKLISIHPIIGSGAGAHINLRDGKVEMLYHDIVSKIGIIGLIVFLLPLIRMLRKKLRTYSCESLDYLRIGYLSAIVCLFVSSYSNPYAMGLLGMFVYCVSMRLYSTKDFPIVDEIFSKERI